MVRRITVALAALVALTLFVLIGRSASLVSAHEILLRSEPVDGAELTTPPQHMRLWFSDPLSPNALVTTLINIRGQVIPGIIATTSSSESDATAPAMLTVEFPRLPPGLYALNWQVISSADLHQTKGTIVFGVQQPTGQSELAAEAVPNFMEIALRWFDLIGLCSLIGSIVVARLFGMSDESLIQACRTRALSVGLVGALIALLTGIALLLTPLFSMNMTLLQLLFETSYGPLLLVRELLILGLAGCVIALFAGWQGHALRIALVSALLLVIVEALRGHAAAFNSLSVIRIAAQALHLLGAAIWAGGVPVLVLTVYPLLWRSDTAPLAWRALQRFGKTAMLALAVLAITGVYSAGQQIASLDALLTTHYGQVLLVKLVCVIVICCLGLLNAATIHSWLGALLTRLHVHARLFRQDTLNRRMVIEATLICILLLTVAVLASSQPAHGPQFAQQAGDDMPQLPAAALVDDLLVNMSIQPGRAGTNFVSLDTLNTRRPVPAPFELVQVQLRPPDYSAAIVLQAQATAPERFQIAGADLPMAGDWQAIVTIRRPGLPDSITSMVWPIKPAAAHLRPTLISRQPLEPFLTSVAMVAAIFLGIVLVGWSVFRQGFRVSLHTNQRQIKEHIK